MFIERRLCVNCLEDFAESWSAIGHCYACSLEHDRAVVLQRMTFSHRNNSEVDWWGITANEINPEDVAGGFYVAHIDGRDDAEMDEFEREQA